MKMKKIFTVTAIVASMLLSVSCGKKSDNVDNDTEGKTTIRVGTYNGGIGMDWLKTAAKEFETQYANAHFEDGKTGVSVLVSEADGGDMLATKNLNKDIYLTEQVDYYTNFVNKNKLADITDTVNQKLSEFGETSSIADKMDDSMKGYLTAKDGKYYAIPFYDGIYGFIYNVDMFEENGWYFGEDGNFIAADGQKSKGKDGVSGTYDDGLPKTYSQFGKLVEQIRNNSDKTPFIYGLDVEGTYTNRAIISYWSDYEGKSNMNVNYSLSGAIDVIDSFSGTTPVIKKKNISTDSNNINLLQAQPGKYYALKFLEDVVCGNSGNSEAIAAGYSQAQFEFIAGNKAQNKGAMLIDGIWWENEADIAGHFDSVAKTDFEYDASLGEYKKTQNYAFMPIPMTDEKAADGTASRKQTLFSLNSSYCFINGETDGAKLEVSKKFLQFLHTDAQLSAFTVETSITRSLNYNISAEDEAKATPYGKSVIAMKKSSDIVYPYSSADYFIKNSAQFSESNWIWKATVNGRSVISPFEEFINKNMDATEYFKGLKAAH